MGEKIISIGAEAVIILREENGKKIIVKERMPKKYRVKELDIKIRKQRNKEEVKILQKLSKIIPVPKVVRCEEFKIFMEFIEGVSLKTILEKEGKIKMGNASELIGEEIGKIISKMHAFGIVHGDITPSNFIISKNLEKRKWEISLIDFGLSYFSRSIEDFATDLFVMEETFKIFGEKGRNVLKSAFSTYFSNFEKGNDIKKRLEKIRKRRRYV